MNQDRSDESDNNLVAAGALLAALLMAGQTADVVMVDGNATNQIDVRFAFMKSPYRITVERVRDEELT